MPIQTMDEQQILVSQMRALLWAAISVGCVIGAMMQPATSLLMIIGAIVSATIGIMVGLPLEQLNQS